jgi:hypothetical protein
MTTLVLVVLAWTLLALSLAFVVGHGIRLADTNRSVRSGSDELRTATHERRAVPAS